MGDQKSKHQKHLSLGALLEAQLRKKCTPLWRESNLPRTLQRRRAFRSRKKRTRLRHEAHIKVKAAKSLHSRSTFERGAVVEKCILKSKFVLKKTCSLEESLSSSKHACGCGALTFGCWTLVLPGGGNDFRTFI